MKYLPIVMMLVVAGMGCAKANDPILYVDNGYVRVKDTDQVYLLVPEESIRVLAEDNNLATLYINVAKTRDSIIGAMITNTR